MSRKDDFSIGQLIQTLDGRTGIVTGHSHNKWAELEVRFDDSDYDVILANSIALMKRSGGTFKPFSPTPEMPLA